MTPSHQFPTGAVLPVPRRLALLDWAARAGAYVVEDDYDSEYRYAARPIESLQGLDRGGRVIYVGTFSKVLFPALRLGYLVVPPGARGAFRAAKALADTGSVHARAARARRLHPRGTLRAARPPLAGTQRRAPAAALLEAVATQLGERASGAAPTPACTCCSGCAALPARDCPRSCALPRPGVGVYPATPHCLAPPRVPACCSATRR